MNTTENLIVWPAVGVAAALAYHTGYLVVCRRHKWVAHDEWPTGLNVAGTGLAAWAATSMVVGPALALVAVPGSYALIAVAVLLGRGLGELAAKRRVLRRERGDN